MDVAPGTRSPELHTPLPERGSVPVEQTLEKKVDRPAPAPEVQPIDLAPSAPVTLTPPPTGVAVDPVIQQVEDVLSAGMGPAFASMDQATQAKFKTVGEETAVTISRMLQQTKIQVKKIVQLILIWLKIIPGVNPFYLEQEAKIKADALLKIRSTQDTPP